MKHNTLARSSLRAKLFIFKTMKLSTSSNCSSALEFHGSCVKRDGKSHYEHKVEVEMALEESCRQSREIKIDNSHKSLGDDESGKILGLRRFA